MPVSLALLSSLDGEIAADPETLARFGEDFGNMARREPPAVVFRPRNVEAVAALMGLAAREGFRVAARGAGHTTGGQALVHDGVIVDMRYLRAIREVSADSVWVEAGLHWSELSHAMLSCGSLPIVLTGYLGLSIGGTLSVGGIGLRSFRFGAQIDNVTQLEVVTGKGEHVVCSLDEARPLFDACRAGLGQFGIITGARVGVSPAATRVQSYDLVYPDAGTCLAEQERLMMEGRFDEVGAMLVWVDGRWQFMLQLALDIREGEPPSVEEALRGVPIPASGVTHVDHTCREFIDRVEQRANAMKQFGLWDAPHPWASFFLPARAMPHFLAAFVDRVTEEGVGYGPIGLYPLRRDRFTTPFLRVPSDETFYLVAVLPNAFPVSPERTQALIELVQWQYRFCAEHGGTVYPIGMLPPAWQRNGDLGGVQSMWDAAKRMFDPAGVLGRADATAGGHGKQSA